MAPPNETVDQKRDREIGSIFEKARTHENFIKARKSAQETTATILTEENERQKVDIIFKDNYASAKYRTEKAKPTIETGKTHMLLGNVDSDAFDSNYERGPDYYQDLKRNAALFIKLKDYININFPALKDPTKKARMLEMIDKTRFLGNALNIISFKEFCSQNNFTKKEVFGKEGLLQVLLAFSRAIEPVENRNLLTVENFEITEKNPNPLFYRIDLGIGNSGTNDKDRFSIVLKSEFGAEAPKLEEDDEDKGKFVPGDADKIAPPPDDDEPEDPEEPAVPTEPAQPTAPPAKPPATPEKPPEAPAQPTPPADAPPSPAKPPAEPAKQAEAPEPTLSVITFDIQIDNVVTKFEIQAPGDLTFEPPSPEEPASNTTSYIINVKVPNATDPNAPPKEGTITFSKTPGSNPVTFSYIFTNNPDVPSTLDIWKFYEPTFDETKPSIKITKRKDRIAVPSINLIEKGDKKQLTIFPETDIGKHKVYDIIDNTGKIQFRYFNENGKQYIALIEGEKYGTFEIASGNSLPIRTPDADANYSTDIFQHYAFDIKEGSGTTPGTIEITEAASAVKDTQHALKIALDSEKPTEKTKFTLTIKAPENQVSTVDVLGPETDGAIMVEFGGLKGFFQLRKNDDGSYSIDNFGNSASGYEDNSALIVSSSEKDLWRNYKISIEGTVITIKKLEKPPHPRLEYDENESTVTFFNDGDNETSTTYKINKPDNVTVRYRNALGDDYLSFSKSTAMIYIEEDESIYDPFTMHPDSSESFLATHNISLDKKANPKTLNITEISNTVHPDAPRVLFKSDDYTAETGKGAFQVHFKDGEKETYNLELPQDTKAFYTFMDGKHYLMLQNNSVFQKDGEDQLNFNIQFSDNERKPTVDNKDLQDTYSYEFVEDTKTIKIYKKGSTVTTPAAPVAPPPAPAPAPPTGAPSPTAAPTVPAPAVPAEAPAFKLGDMTFKFPSGTIKAQNNGKTVEYTVDGKPFTIELSSDGKANITSEYNKYLYTLHVTSTGNERTVEVKPATIAKIDVSPAKDKITVTLDNTTSRIFNLVLPEGTKDKITLTGYINKSVLEVEYAKSDSEKYGGAIQFNTLSKIDSNKYIPKTVALTESRHLFGDTDSNAPFALNFDPGTGDASPTITLISNEEAKKLTEKVTELATFLNPINKIFDTKFSINADDIDKTISDLVVNNYVKYLTGALNALDPASKKIIKTIDIKLSTKTEKTGETAAYLNYNAHKSAGQILAELKKVIAFWFVVWTPAIEKEATDTSQRTDGRKMKCKSDIGNSNIFYLSTSFNPADPSTYKAAEGDYTIEFSDDGKIEKMHKYDSNMWKLVIGRPQKPKRTLVDAKKLGEKPSVEESWWQRWYSDAYDGL